MRSWLSRLIADVLDSKNFDLVVQGYQAWATVASRAAKDLLIARLHGNRGPFIKKKASLKVVPARRLTKKHAEAYSKFAEPKPKKRAAPANVVKAEVEPICIEDDVEFEPEAMELCTPEPSDDELVIVENSEDETNSKIDQLLKELEEQND